MVRAREQLTDRNRLFNKTADKLKSVEKEVRELEDKKLSAEKESGLLKIEAENANRATLVYREKLGHAEAELQAAKSQLAEAQGKLREWEDGAEARDQKNYDEGCNEATEFYKKQVREYMQKAYTEGYILGLCKSEVPETSTLFKEMPAYPFPQDPTPEADKNQETPARQTSHPAPTESINLD